MSEDSRDDTGTTERAPTAPTWGASERAARQIGPTGAASTDSASTSEAIAQQDWEIEYRCLKATAYHGERRAFLDTCHRLVMFSVVFFGSAAISGLVPQTHAWVLPWLVAIPATAGLLDLVFNLSDRARDHEFAYRVACGILADFRELPYEDRIPHLPRFERRISEMFSNSAPQYFKALDSICHNRVCEQFGLIESRLKIPFHHKLLRNVFPFMTASYKYVTTD